jgi:hypothetical protein
MILVDASTVSNDGVELRFKGSYAIRDTYDFDNDRSMFPAYDRYRKELATQFASDPFTCILRFNKDLVDAPTSGGDAKVGPLNKSLVFTCFMYAIEINRCTSPLFWEAEIPFDGMARLSCVDARLTRSGQ